MYWEEKLWDTDITCNRGPIALQTEVSKTDQHSQLFLEERIPGSVQENTRAVLLLSLGRQKNLLSPFSEQETPIFICRLLVFSAKPNTVDPVDRFPTGA